MTNLSLILRTTVEFVSLAVYKQSILFHLESKITQFDTRTQPATVHPSQIGFLPGFRTGDHIFSLRTIIDKNVTHRYT